MASKRKAIRIKDLVDRGRMVSRDGERLADQVATSAVCGLAPCDYPEIVEQVHNLSGGLEGCHFGEMSAMNFVYALALFMAERDLNPREVNRWLMGRKSAETNTSEKNTSESRHLPPSGLPSFWS
jgi:hypothetical protein